jgi:TolB-like protein/tetratricopeptide (TPR) repeat protein
MSETSPHCYEFGPYRLDPVERTLAGDGGWVRITPKDFEVLLLLILSGGNVVEKDRLLQEVWPDTFVEDANLAVHVARLRKALGQRPDGGPYIETVPRRGYRFATAVRQVRRVDTAPAAGQALHAGALEQGHLSQFLSLAVLPLVNASGDEGGEYLSEGIAESIISALSHQSRLRVLARGTVFRYKGRENDPVEVGRELRADAVLTGRIVQLGERMIIRVELTDASNGWQIWGAQYDSGPTDLLSIQGEVSRQISESLRLRLSQAEEQLLTKRHTESVEAFHLYLRGRHYWAKYTAESLKIATEYFRMALEADPTYALAYVGLAESYMRLSEEHIRPKEAIPKAKAAALRALEIDETLAEPHATLALVRARHEWDWAAAELDIRRALELKPGYALAHHWYASLLLASGRFEEALAELAVAGELDPLSLQIKVGKAITFYLMRRYDRASEICAKVVEEEPCHHSARVALGLIYLQMGRHDEAIAELQIGLQLSSSPTAHSCLGFAHAVAGNGGEARRLLGELMAMSASRYVSPYAIALIHVGLGEGEMALRWLERAFEEKSEYLSLLKTDPRLDSLRPDARFTDLLRRVRLHP